MKRIAALVLSGLILFLPSCTLTTDEADRAAGLVPADALGYFSVSLNPSASQKANLLNIAEKFSKAKVTDDYQSTVDGLLTEMFKDSGYDYKADIKPWLGDEAAIAALPGLKAVKKTTTTPGPFGDSSQDSTSRPRFLALIESKDDAKANAFLTKAKKAKDVKANEYKLIENYIVLTDSETAGPTFAQVEKLAKDTDSGLASEKKFTSVVDKLKEDRLAVGWVDTQAFAEAIGESGSEISRFFGVRGLSTSAGQSGPLAFGIHSTDSSIVTEGVGEGDETINTKTGEAKLTSQLPANTLAALTLFDLSGILKGVTKQADINPAAIIASTGLDYNKDILSWLGGEAVVVVGPVAKGAQSPEFALVIDPSNQPAAAAALPKFVALAGSQLGAPLEEYQVGSVKAYRLPQAIQPGVQPAMALFDGRFVLASSPAYLKQLSKASSPGFDSSDSYKNAISDDSKDETYFQLVVQVDPIREAIEQFMTNPADKAEYEKDIAPNLKPIEAFGVRVWQDGKVGRFELKVTFD